jgi:hypothetical protein
VRCKCDQLTLINVKCGRNVSADSAVKVSVFSLICGLLRHEVQICTARSLMN